MQINFHSNENEFNLRVNEDWFAYERMRTKTRFENEAWGNSEMAYSKLCNVQIYDITTLAVLYIIPHVDFGSGEVIMN